MEDAAKKKDGPCVKFEPQTWRKNLCKNCFKIRDQHDSPPAPIDKPKAAASRDKEENNSEKDAAVDGLAPKKPKSDPQDGSKSKTPEGKTDPKLVNKTGKEEELTTKKTAVGQKETVANNISPVKKLTSKVESKGADKAEKPSDTTAAKVKSTESTSSKTGTKDDKDTITSKFGEKVPLKKPTEPAVKVSKLGDKFGDKFSKFGVTLKDSKSKSVSEDNLATKKTIPEDRAKKTGSASPPSSKTEADLKSISKDPKPGETKVLSAGKVETKKPDLKDSTKTTVTPGKEPAEDKSKKPNLSPLKTDLKSVSKDKKTDENTAETKLSDGTKDKLGTKNSDKTTTALKKEALEDKFKKTESSSAIFSKSDLKSTKKKKVPTATLR